MARKPKFPTFAVIVLVMGLVWMLSELGVITIDVPWLPLILIIVSSGWIVNNYSH